MFIIGIVADEKRWTKRVSNSRLAKWATHMRKVSFWSCDGGAEVP
jgi:hypothetical protein